MRYANMRGKTLLLVGFGSLGPAVLPLVFRHIDIAPNDIVVMTAEPRNRELAESLGVRFLVARLTRSNFTDELRKLLKPGDVLLNLSLGVSSQDLIEFCRLVGVLYLDTNTEDWSEQKVRERRTTFVRRKALIESEARKKNAPTALICHGINPGLVSHFLKRALLEIVKSDLSSEATDPRERAHWALLASSLGVHSIHISEYDSQGRSSADDSGVANTWSVEGLADELQELAAFAAGTRVLEGHDEWRCRLQVRHHRQEAELEEPASSVTSETWTPTVGRFRGFLVSHPEVFSIADYLTISDPFAGIRFRPNVQFVYRPCDAALRSFTDATRPKRRPNGASRLLLEEIDYGADEVGVLVVMEDKDQAFWFGSRLSIDVARQLAPHNNATSLQTAAGILGGLIWLLAHPDCGLVEPEEIDSELVLQVAMPYLGDLTGHWTRWCASRSISRRLPIARHGGRPVDWLRLDAD